MLRRGIGGMQKEKSRILGLICSALISIVLAACLPPTKPPMTDSVSTFTPSPTPTRTPSPTPTHTPSPTPDPLARYEGECVFCFLDGRNPLEPVWDESTRGFTYQEGDPRKIVIIDESFHVPADESFVFDDKIILIRPTQRRDIEVYGTLTIRDSLMIWQQTEHQQTRLLIKYGGTLIIQDSFSFWGNQYWVNWDFEDGSTIHFDHFIGDPWCYMEGSVEYTAINLSTVKLTIGYDTHDTSVQISDAHHVWLELYPPEGTYTVTLPEKQEWADWNVPGFWPDTSVEVEHSYIYDRDIGVSNNTHITIQDTPSGFSLAWSIGKGTPEYVDCELRNLGEPGNASGVFYENRTWKLPCNNSSLTVENSLLQRAWPVTWGWVHLKVSDSFLVDIRNYGAPSTIEIHDSTIDIVAAYSGGRVYVENSPIRIAIEVKDPNSVIYGYGITGAYELLESDGGTYVELEVPGPPWQ